MRVPDILGHRALTCPSGPDCESLVGGPRHTDAPKTKQEGVPAVIEGSDRPPESAAALPGWAAQLAGASPHPRGLRVQFPDRAHTEVAGLAPRGVHVGGTYLMFLSLPPSSSEINTRILG